jgi:hypothetical protein
MIVLLLFLQKQNLNLYSRPSLTLPNGPILLTYSRVCTEAVDPQWPRCAGGWMTTTMSDLSYAQREDRSPSQATVTR